MRFNRHGQRSPVYCYRLLLQIDGSYSQCRKYCSSRSRGLCLYYTHPREYDTISPESDDALWAEELEHISMIIGLEMIIIIIIVAQDRWMDDGWVPPPPPPPSSCVVIASSS